MRNRNPSLDVLRGIAVLMVILFHHLIYVNGTASILPFGWMGVDLFFVLSGFLIGGLMLREFAATGEIHVARFLIRRGLKIWPAFYFFLAVIGACVWISRPHFPWRMFANAALFIRNYAPGDHSLLFIHTWTLAVEEHFYLVLALCLATLCRCNRVALVPWLWLLLVPSCIALRAISAPFMAFFSTHCRVDSLFTGVALSYLYHFHPGKFQKIARLPIVGGLLLLPAMLIPRNEKMISVVWLSFIAIGFALILAWSMTKKPTGKLANALAFVGVYSYSIYLWQFAAGFVVDALAPQPLRFPLYELAAVALGVGMGKLVEIPVLHIRDRVFPPHQFVVFTPNSAALTPDPVQATPVFGSLSRKASKY